MTEVRRSTRKSLGKRDLEDGVVLDKKQIKKVKTEMEAACLADNAATLNIQREGSPKKRGRKKNSASPRIECKPGTCDHPIPASTIPHQYRCYASSSGISALGAPCLAEETSSSGVSALEGPSLAVEKRHVHFLPNEIRFEDISNETEQPGCSGLGMQVVNEDMMRVPDRDQGTQVKMEVVRSLFNHRSVQTVESRMGHAKERVKNLGPEEHPEPAVEPQSAKQLKPERQEVSLEPKASCSKTARYDNQEQMEVDADAVKVAGEEAMERGSSGAGPLNLMEDVAGTSGLVDAGRGNRHAKLEVNQCQRSSRDRETRSGDHEQESTNYRLFAEHDYVWLELLIEFLILCFLVWFFKYR